jgi:hypothetical protein
MKVTIELSGAEESQLIAAARQEGIEPAELVRKLVVENLPTGTPDGKPTDPTLALFAQWEREDDQMTPDEIEAARQEFEQFKQGINAVRAQGGARLIYP